MYTSINMSEITTPIASLTTIVYHTPSNSKNIGSTIMHTIGSTSARIKEIAADTTPLFYAVNNEDAYMLNHMTRNEIEQI